jgi:hypothetical protein
VVFDEFSTPGWRLKEIDGEETTVDWAIVKLAE